MLFAELVNPGHRSWQSLCAIALGLTLVYGLLRILHVAHAALFTLGGYVGVIVTNQSGSLLLALIVAALLVGMVGHGRHGGLPAGLTSRCCRARPISP